MMGAPAQVALLLACALQASAVLTCENCSGWFTAQCELLCVCSSCHGVRKPPDAPFLLCSGCESTAATPFCEPESACVCTEVERYVSTWVLDMDLKIIAFMLLGWLTCAPIFCIVGHWCAEPSAPNSTQEPLLNRAQ
mmetsp:Transcript_29887/g.56038  ORF Transcript_29887/g.56038 Transcript_29887/m.56038 type:complete len:137 (-) Transcript_29887:124-534(-)